LSNTEITAHFGDDGSQVAGTVTGSGGCNDYFTGFQVDLSTMGIKFNQVGATEMDCGEEIMGQEFAYFAALAKTNRHEIFGDKLKLRGESGVMLLLFIPLLVLDDSAQIDGDTATEANGLVGTEWKATSYAAEGASADLVPILSGSDVTLEFGSGTLNGYGGCNSYFGSYASSADGRLTIFELGSTEMGCIDPPGRMGQEMAYFKALQNAAEYRLRGIGGVGIHTQVLLLLDDNGNIVLTFVPAETDFDINQDFNTLVAANTSEVGLNEGLIDGGDLQVSITETVMMEDQDFEIYDAARDASSARADAMMSLAPMGFVAATSMVEYIYLLL
jgi:heat shock protein HslJ